MEDNGLSWKAAKKLLEKVANTQKQEYSCDECFEVLDVFAELAALGKDPARYMPLVQQHINMCSDCRQEFEALMDVLEELDESDLTQ
jgi:hypothetical protein